jgi:DNA-binding PadR family transcriptional regulator
MDHRSLLTGFVRLHVLHHATERELYGQWMIKELRRHGYKTGPGTLYPMLHAMEQAGYIRSKKKRVGRVYRRVYIATPSGRKALRIAKEKLQELFEELVADRS